MAKYEINGKTYNIDDALPAAEVTKILEASLLIDPGALLVGTLWAKQIFPFSVSALKLSQFLYFPVDLGVLALAWKVKANKNKNENICL